MYHHAVLNIKKKLVAEWEVNFLCGIHFKVPSSTKLPNFIWLAHCTDKCNIAKLSFSRLYTKTQINIKQIHTKLSIFIPFIILTTCNEWLKI